MKYWILRNKTSAREGIVLMGFDWRCKEKKISRDASSCMLRGLEVVLLLSVHHGSNHILLLLCTLCKTCTKILIHRERQERKGDTDVKEP